MLRAALAILATLFTIGAPEAGTRPGVPAAPPHVVLAVSAVTVNPTTVTGGTSLTGTVTLTGPARAGGVTVTLSSSNPATVTVPPSVVVPAGATTSNIIINTQLVWANPNVVPPQPGVTISARIGSGAAKTATLNVVGPTLGSLAVSPDRVPGGNGSTGRITLTAPAPAGGLAIGLSVKVAATSPSRPDVGGWALEARGTASPVTMPTSLTVPAGQTTATFPISTAPRAAPLPVPIVASWGAFVSKTATLTVLAPQVKSIGFSPSRIAGAGSAVGTVVLTAVAPPEGISVKLSALASKDFVSVDTSPSVCVSWVKQPAPATLPIPGGATTGTFTVGFQTTSTDCRYQVIATYCVSDPQCPSWVSAVKYGPPTVSALTLAPPSVKGGALSVGRVTLTASAIDLGGGGIVVYLSSSNSTAATVPASVLVPTGAGSATFNITTSGVPSATSVTIGGRINNHFSDAVQATLTITPK